MKSGLLSIGVLLGLLPAAAWANGPLRSVVIFGNEKTEQQTILEIINIPSNTFVNDQLMQEVDDRLTHSGLFKTVKIRRTANPDGTADLRILVVEKQLWFVFPIFQSWSGQHSGGAVFGESNLFTPGGSTLFVAQGGNKLSRGFGAFEARNLFDTNFSLRTWLLVRSDDVPIYTGQVRTDEINMKDVSYALRTGYHWTNDIETALQFDYTRIYYGKAASVADSGRAGNDIAIEFQFVYDTLKRREAFLKGRRLAVSYGFADSRFGTDFTYHTQEASWQQAMPLWKYFNYVFSIEGKMGDETLPFHREFTLGGTSLRGFEDRQFRGDTVMVGKQDLLFRIFRHSKFAVFGLGFYDLGLLYNEKDGLGRSSIHNGVGGGLRVSLSEILAPVFGFDAGYGIEDHTFRMYLAVGLVNF